MGQRHSGAIEEDTSPYAGKDVGELLELVEERGIYLPHRLVLSPDHSLLSALLCAYDLGLDTGIGGPESSMSRRTSVSGSPKQHPLPACAKVFPALKKIRDAPGHLGVDIGGTLAKMALAIPRDAADHFVLPESFGTTGRTHNNLSFDLIAKEGQEFSVRFVSGSTINMEHEVQRLMHSRRKGCGRLRSKSIAEEVETLLDDESEQFGEDSDSFVLEPVLSDNPDSFMQRDVNFSRNFSDWSDAGSTSYRPFRRVAAAGGGASKFAPLFLDALRVEIVPVKELSAVIDGLLLLASCHPAADLLFTIGEDGNPIALPWPDPLFPLILVNMGSGVSILRVDSAAPNDYVRVGGTACGGGTFLGLARALTSAKTFQQALSLAEAGDAGRADKLVSDIYGVEGCEALGLPGNLTAVNFGKLGDVPSNGGMPCSEADLARSLLQMVTQQSVILGGAFARQAGCVGRVFFVGGFVDENNRIARRSIAQNFRNLGGCAYFLTHSDFLGALGSLRAALHEELT
mmetsp:Transcript_2140/g.4925  ORF Transcript_2140/g.4925 Transcript_2140/m.4925 type:complete len:515 (-) Transcript_2140:139-1683(-)|eukprot:CAMPEP_0170592324 /NCGR_PEP_ID=MMETSP0224-20130122/12865_1 /TAXON_ID=285029 /ORGANISM="Togula jolla, Strain CCCM 725" /LENGTH=514 /DNA_ID=CAMNT_0010916225 /DNA_START=55 /DNA_END=1599 /DNA_ORIENTATION=-